MNKELIGRYLRGEATEQERGIIEKWIAEEGPQWLDNYFDQEWNHPVIESDQTVKDVMAERVLAGIHSQEQPKTIPAKRTTIRRVAAASFLIAALAGWWLVSRQSSSPVTALRWQTVSNDSTGYVKTVILPDSSKVLLNAHSSLRYTINFNDTAREVELSGEAFFEVTHNAERAFIVHAGSLNTRVYGTQFNIAAYPDESQFRVALKQGSIGVTGKHLQERKLTPGTLLLFNKTDSTIQLDHQNTSDIGTWASGKLHFYKTPLRDVLLSLERKFGTKFRFDSTLSNQTITASFDLASLQQVLQHLSFVWNLQFDKRRNEIFVH